MSDADLLARIEALEARDSPEISPQVAVNPDGTPGTVAAGELIESAWGNAVSNTVGLLWDRLVQGGIVGITTDTNSCFRITYPTPFANASVGLSIILYSPGGAAVARYIQVAVVQLDPAFVIARAFDYNGAPFPNGTTANVTWVGVGTRP